MRRRSNFKASDAKRKRNESGEVSHILQNFSGPSVSCLPRDFLIDVLVRLSVKSILVCKSVYKSWYDLISSPEFAKLHFEQGQVYPLIRFQSLPVLFLLQPENHEFDMQLDMCDHTGARLGCFCNVNVELNTRFELPLSQYRVVNSCNGLLCLCGPSDNDPLIICNPVLGEYMKLPVPETNPKVTCVAALYGFGFSPENNKYKVIRMIDGWLRDEGKNAKGIMAQVLTLGQEIWKDKDLGFYMFKDFERIPPTYLNGFLYWFSKVHPLSMFSFDIEKELFMPVEAPPVKNTNSYSNNVGMGVLGEELCIIGIGDQTSSNIIIDVLVMKDQGDNKEWSKVFSLDLYSNLGRAAGGPYKPIKYLNDGALLMALPFHNVLVYKDLRKQGFRCLKLPISGRAEVIAHTPSFVSLKQAFSGHNVNLLNVESRYMGSGSGLSVVEEEVMADWEIGSDSEDRDMGSDSEHSDLGSTEEMQTMKIMEMPTQKAAGVSAVKVITSLGIAVAGAAIISHINLSFKK